MAEIKTKHGLPETKGFFKVRGNITGMQRENTFKQLTTKTKKQMNILNFGVETAPESTVYLTLQGIERDDVYFGKRAEKKGEKGQTKKVKWADRHDDQGEGFNLMGISIGLEQDEKGKNVITNFTELDATEYLNEELKDEMPVFIRGDIEFSSFKNNKDEVRHSKKFVPKSIYNSNSIDFEAEDFKETADFKQKIIFMGIEKVDDKDDPRFQVEAKVVTYGSIENTDFIIRNTSLANQLRKGLKPYQAIEVWGNIYNKVDSDEVEEQTSVWGEEDNFKKINKSYIRELVIIGADPETIDSETYSEEAIEEGINKLNSQGQVDSGVWGSKEDKDKVEIDEDDIPW